MTIQYKAFLLRIWWVGESEPRALSLSLEDPRTHQLITFTSYPALMEYLQHAADSVPEIQSHEPSSQLQPGIEN